MITKNATDIKSFFTHNAKKSLHSKDREALLMSISEKIVTEYQENKIVNLNFICTHNSRRSQFAQVWAFYAIEFFNLKNIFSFSGGTETTAFFRNTVVSLREVGFSFNIVDFSHQNPKYSISFEGAKTSILGYSKRYDDPNNKNPFIAITTCNNADKNCPFIPEAIERFHLPYVDPKHSDNTVDESKIYLETSKEIAAEMHFIFKNIAKILS